MVFRHFDRFGRNACIQRIDRRPPDDRNTPARTCSRRLRTHDQRSGPLSSSPDDRELSHQESGATAAPRPPFFATSKAGLADEFRFQQSRKGAPAFPAAPSHVFRLLSLVKGISGGQQKAPLTYCTLMRL